jgi:hypothetical protein
MCNDRLEGSLLGQLLDHQLRDGGDLQAAQHSSTQSQHASQLSTPTET